jgi:hypothetical protein
VFLIEAPCLLFAEERGVRRKNHGRKLRSDTWLVESVKFPDGF